MPGPNDDLADAGKRMANIINGQLAFQKPWEIRAKWMAFRLDDGNSDNVIYDSMSDAKRFTDPDYHCYFAFRGFLGGISPRECSIFLTFHRDARKAGLPQADPDSQPFMSVNAHQRYTNAVGNYLS